MVPTRVYIFQQLLSWSWRFNTSPMNPIISRRSRRVAACAARQARLAAIQRHLAAAKRLRIVALLSLLGTGITAANARVIIERAFPNGTAAQPLGPEW